MITLTVFTPTYNRAHTIGRTYESLCRQTCKDFEWLVIDDGSTDNTRTLIEQFAKEAPFKITYAYKENGGLYTGYNKAYELINTELNVCIDSDDFMPDHAVELILQTWKAKGSKDYAGIMGLDYYAFTDKPIGGLFPNDLKACSILDLEVKKLHYGDVKQVMRTDLMRAVAPQVGFEGEKNFNPIYMLWQATDTLPLIIVNENLCFVEYQEHDSMSKNIYQQYINSPRSFAKMRLLLLSLKRNNLRGRMRAAIHYVAECLIARDKHWLKNTQHKALVLAMAPLGLCVYALIRYKTR